MPRKRERSRTPEVQWEKLPAQPVPPIAVARTAPDRPAKIAAATKVALEPKVVDTVPDLTEAEKAARYEAAVGMETRSWRYLLIRMAAMQGDPKIHAILKEKHPELLGLVQKCGTVGEKATTVQQAKEIAKPWFERRLRGSNNHGPAARAQICNQVVEILKNRAAELRRDGDSPAEILDRGDASEEGPFICTTLGDELKGSRYEGLWISRESPGIYVIGDEGEESGLPALDQIGAKIHPRVRVVLKVAKDRLTVDGFYHDGEDTLIPARVPIGPFLGVYFEGLTLKKALAQWADREAEITNVKSSSSNGQALKDVQAAAATLPPGWELRESRSKKGVYYYAHPAKGLTSFERPKA